MAIHVVEFRLTEHMHSSRQAVALPVGGLDGHFDARLAQHGAAAFPVLFLQFEAEPHLVRRAHFPFRMRTEVSFVNFRIADHAHELVFRQPFAVTQRR